MTNKTPTMSVTIPTLNEEKHLPNLLKDLEKQTFKDFEVIVVDAQSDDKTTQKASKHKGKIRMEIITSKKRNVSYQRNLGAKKARADWLVFMDADNRLPYYFLQGIKYKIEKNNPDLLTTWIKPDSKNKKDIAAATLANIVIDIQKTSKSPYLFESMLVVKKGAFQKLGGFDETLSWGEGNDLLRRGLRKRMKFTFVREPKYTYSFRRLRKQGTFKTLRNASQIELARLTNKQISKKKARRLYPMEGGKYFEVDEKPLSRIEKIVSKLFSTPPLKRDNKLSIFEKIFSQKRD